MTISSRPSRLLHVNIITLMMPSSLRYVFAGPRAGTGLAWKAVAQSCMILTKLVGPKNEGKLGKITIYVQLASDEKFRAPEIHPITYYGNI